MSTVWMVSMILHVLLIVFLAVFTLTQVTNNDPISLAMEVVSDAEIASWKLTPREVSFQLACYRIRSVMCPKHAYKHFHQPTPPSHTI